MKKKIIAGLMMVCMLALAGCGQSGTSADSFDIENTGGNQTDEVEDSLDMEDSGNAAATASDTQTPMEENSEETDAAGGSSEILVVYFSRTGEQYNVGVIDKGNTAIVADMIAEQTGADVFEILPQEDYYPYTYNELTDVAKKELNENARPEYAGEVPELSQYSTIFIGAPVWWGDWPMIMYTFFEKNADGLEGKTLIPFSTHAGSGLSGFDRKLSDACPDSTVGTGLAIAGTDAQNDQDNVRNKVNDWLSGLGF